MLRTFLRVRAGPLLRERESVSDLVQTVCREALEHLGDFEYHGEAPFRKWLFQKALSKLVDRQRFQLADRRSPAREEPLADRTSQAEEQGLYASLLSPSGAAIRDEDLDSLEAVFAQLPDDYREVITMSRIWGYTHAEIARDLGRSEGATRILLHRALARLGWLVTQGRRSERGK